MVVLVLLVGVVAACGSDDAITERFGCPEVVILRDAAEVVRFRPGAPKTQDNLAVRGRLALARGACDYDDDEVTVEFPVRVVVDRGPAQTTDSADFAYFVAVVRPDGQPWNRQSFRTSVAFERGLRRAGNEEEFELTLPVGDGVNAAGYQIVLGFELSREELEWNRRPRENPVPRVAP